MKNRLIPCVLACLMIFLVGCNGNTAKEAAQEITKTETSFPAGNTETDSQEETAEEPESTTVQEETPITAEESQSTAERQTVATVQTKPAEEKTADTPATEKPKAEPPKQTTTQAEPEKQTEQPKEQTTAEQKPVEKPTEKPAEPKPTEPHKQTFDVSPYVSYAKEYAVSIYQLLTMLGVALTDQIVFILLCCSPLLALAWCYVMYQISYRIFVKQEL